MGSSSNPAAPALDHPGRPRASRSARGGYRRAGLSAEATGADVHCWRGGGHSGVDRPDRRAGWSPIRVGLSGTSVGLSVPSPRRSPPRSGAGRCCSWGAFRSGPRPRRTSRPGTRVPTSLLRPVGPSRGPGRSGREPQRGTRRQPRGVAMAATSYAVLNAVAASLAAIVLAAVLRVGRAATRSPVSSRIAPAVRCGDAAAGAGVCPR